MYDIEKKREEIVKKNYELLNEFKIFLEEQGLSKKTIIKHLNNMNFYFNKYLIYYAMYDNENGETVIANAIDGVNIDFIDEFLGNFFIRKVLWSNENAVKSNITSFKRFIKFLHTKGLIMDLDFEILKENIKDLKDDWIRKVNLYNDPNTNFEDIMYEFD